MKLSLKKIKYPDFAFVASMQKSDSPVLAMMSMNDVLCHVMNSHKVCSAAYWGDGAEPAEWSISALVPECIDFAVRAGFSRVEIERWSAGLRGDVGELFRNSFDAVEKERRSAYAADVKGRVFIPGKDNIYQRSLISDAERQVEFVSYCVKAWKFVSKHPDILAYRAQIAHWKMGEALAADGFGLPEPKAVSLAITGSREGLVRIEDFKNDSEFSSFVRRGYDRKMSELRNEKMLKNKIRL